MTPEFRPLSAVQKEKLISQGCTCSDWSLVHVAKDFDPSKLRLAHFSGRVNLGSFKKDVTLSGGMVQPSGICCATIHNCTIGNNVLIHRIGSCIANYIIEDDVIIDNIGLLAIDGETAFGNGTEASVINEGGGRTISICDRLCAHTAYIAALYRHRPRAVEAIRKMTADYSKSVTSTMGLIGKGAKLVNCRIIKNVKIGPCAVIEGADKLENGSINSCNQDPVYIGSAVWAENFIVCSGAKISDGLTITNCFVGQATILGGQFSAENSAFFANCAGFHGEVCSIFAGPYTVTHHKSTLLIAGLFSFFNAGSGTNQSNHRYKLGPIQQGILERGCKAASNSYMVWPSRLAPFTVVLGSHFKSLDITDMPFSYVLEQNGESYLAPGANLRSIGTIRDARKWPSRDNRKDPDRLDCINFEFLSPFTVQKMLKGLEILRQLKQGGEKAGCFEYNGIKIKSSALETGLKLYQFGITKFFGSSLIDRLENKNLRILSDLQSALKPQTDIGTGQWLDLAGLLAPLECIGKILDDIESGRLTSLDDVTKRFKAVHENYAAYEWAWSANALSDRFGKPVTQVGPADIVSFIKQWKDAAAELEDMLYADAEKEFSPTSRIGFGIDGDEKIQRQDFTAVNGTIETNAFIQEMRHEAEKKIKLADALTAQIEKLL